MEILVVAPEEGERAELGVASMRLLVSGEQTAGALGMAQFSGGAGPWTVPHVHHGLEECFFVLRGTFTFTCGDEEHRVTPGALVAVPRGTRHVFRGHDPDGSVLVLWTPGGLERMFLELGRLPGASLTDPVVRAEIARRHDSVPV